MKPNELESFLFPRTTTAKAEEKLANIRIINERNEKAENKK